MNMNIRKVKMPNGLYDLVTVEEYLLAPGRYDTKSTAAIIDGYALPIITESQYLCGYTGVYIKPGNMVYRFNMPFDEDEVYKITSDNMVDFTNASNYGEIIEKRNAVKGLEKELLSGVDNIMKIIIDPTASPAAIAMQEAVNAKECNMDNYAFRYGKNYPNDKREISNRSMTLAKIIRHCNALDIKATLILEDKSPDVPNPMRKTITAVLTGGDE